MVANNNHNIISTFLCISVILRLLLSYLKVILYIIFHLSFKVILHIRTKEQINVIESNYLIFCGGEGKKNESNILVAKIFNQCALMM